MSEADGTERLAIEVEPGQQSPGLTVLTGNLTGQVIRLDQPQFVLGRAEDADIRLDEQGVSRRHASITVNGGVFQLEDLNSTNGTFVGAERITSRTLTVGDQIQVGTVVLRFGFIHDVEQALLRMATCDSLTGAMNKGEFLKALNRARPPLTLALLDLDKFKLINDTWGHPAGDAVLVELTRRVRLHLRPQDIFARYGGEEFAILLKGLTAAPARAVLERIRAEVASDAFRFGANSIPVTLSAGLAQFQQDDADSLLQRADQALYEAKREGRNQVRG